MQIIICGAGKVGSSIAQQLSMENNDVLVIDQSPELLNKISDTLEVRTLVGFASYPGVMEEAGASEADMLIAVTVSDEINMVACQVAHSLFQIPTKIARIRNPNYLRPEWKDLYRTDHLPIDVIISPEIEVARNILHRLHIPGARDTVPFADGLIRMVEVTCETSSQLAHMTFAAIKERYLKGLSLSIIGITREGKFLILQDNERILPGDDVFFLSDHASLDKAMALFGHAEKEARRVVVFGGGNIGFHLAREMETESRHAKVKIIEMFRDRAEYIAERLQSTTVIHGSALDREILLEANIKSSETAIAVTNDDKVNILAASLAKQQGCPRTIALVNNLAYGPIVAGLGIDIVVSPRETTVSRILQHVRRGRVKALHSIQDGEAEVIETEVVEMSWLVNKTVGSLGLPEGAKIGAILREKTMIIPDEDTIIKAHDHVIILSRTEDVKKVENIFSVRLEFF